MNRARRTATVISLAVTLVCLAVIACRRLSVEIMLSSLSVNVSMLRFAAEEWDRAGRPKAWDSSSDSKVNYGFPVVSTNCVVKSPAGAMSAMLAAYPLRGGIRGHFFVCSDGVIVWSLKGWDEVIWREHQMADRRLLIDMWKESHRQ